MSKYEPPFSSCEGSIMIQFAPLTLSSAFKEPCERVVARVLAVNSGSSVAASLFYEGCATTEIIAEGCTVPDAQHKPTDAPVARMTMPCTKSDVAIEDWDVLLNAVKARLRLSVSEPFATPLEPHLHDQAVRIRLCVLECVDALDQLHETLTNEFDGRRRL